MSTAPPTTPPPTTISPTTAPPTTASPTTISTTVGPTTISPTSLAPTTSGPTTPGPTTPSPTTAPPGGGGEVLFPPNIFIYPRPIEISIALGGEPFNKTVFPTPIEITVSPSGIPLSDPTISSGVINIEIVLAHSGTVTQRNKCGWVAWSKIGSLDFTIDETNKAGERPMDWKGCASDILKLDKSVIVYGEGGVSVMIPAANAWGMHTIHRIGTLNKGAVCGTDTEHYFIDKTFKLYRLTSQGLELLDYSEFLAVLDNVSMSLDIETGIIYICDGTYGFVYSTRTKSFGVGPINISSVGYQSESQYLVAPTTEIDMPEFHIATDIYDFGTRHYKTINSIEVGTDLLYKLYASVGTRVKNLGSFYQTPWKLVNPSGVATFNCYGMEFRFHLKSLTYEYFELDYLRVNGVIHGFSYLEGVQ